MHRRMLFSIISGNNLIKTQLLLIVDLISASFVDQSSRFFFYLLELMRKISTTQRGMAYI